MRRIVIVLFTFIALICSVCSFKSIDFKQDRYIDVEIKGEVKNDTKVHLKLGSCIEDALKYVELTKDADLSKISNIDILHNNQIIVIPKRSDNKLISINSATIDELISLPGIGESTANRIIEYRETFGSFINLQDLMNVKGIGTSKFEKIKEYICL